MCGRFSSTKPANIKVAGVNPADLAGVRARYNIAPGQNILSIIQTSGEKHALHLQWGLIPSWSRAQSSGIINARAETLTEKPSFREAFKRRRCLIPADGFYEWKKAGKMKQPYYFQMKDESVFSFAGIWETWKNDGKEIVSCAIITTAPNELVEPVHDRMPVIIHSGDFADWLSDETKPEDLTDLLKPYPAQYMG